MSTRPALRAAVGRVPAARRGLSAVRAARHRTWIAGRDLRGRLMSGPLAPRYAERVEIDPARCTEMILDPARQLGRNASGTVRAGDWDLARAPLRDAFKIDACHRHWEQGVAWEDTGVYEHVMRVIAERPGADGCHTIDDVVARYARLDEIFEQVREEGRLRSARELHPGVREEGGVYVHVDRTGRPLFGGGGMHRLAIARILALDSIPAQVGVVHRDALASWRDSLLR